MGNRCGRSRWAAPRADAELLQGRSWPELRAAASAGEGLPAAWARGARWYRRASRERRARETWGSVITAVLKPLRSEDSLEALRDCSRAHDGNWVHGVATRCGLGEEHGMNLRRIEDAAYGFRWLELAHEWRCDLNASLVGQLPLRWLEPVQCSIWATSAAGADTGPHRESATIPTGAYE